MITECRIQMIMLEKNQDFEVRIDKNMVNLIIIIHLPASSCQQIWQVYSHLPQIAEKKKLGK